MSDATRVARDQRSSFAPSSGNLATVARRQTQVSEENRQIRRVTLWGALANVLLASVKIVGGKLSGSISLVADGIHSLSDLATDVVVVVGVSLGEKPPDESHPYGHGRFETLASILVALALTAVGVYVTREAALSMFVHHESPSSGLVMIVLASLSIVVKEALFQVTKIVARRTRSPALLANAWHHRSDALSSVAVLLGGIVGLAGFPHGDHVAGIVVGGMVVFVGGKIGFENLCEFLEQSVDQVLIEQIRTVLDRHPEVQGWHELRSRKVGREVFADVHVLVKPDLTVREGHAVADELEEALHQTVKDPINISIHIEPSDDKET